RAHEAAISELDGSVSKYAAGISMGLLGYCNRCHNRHQNGNALAETLNKTATREHRREVELLFLEQFLPLQLAKGEVDKVFGDRRIELLRCQLRDRSDGGPAIREFPDDCCDA